MDIVRRTSVLACRTLLCRKTAVNKVAPLGAPRPTIFPPGPGLSVTIACRLSAENAPAICRRDASLNPNTPNSQVNQIAPCRPPRLCFLLPDMRRDGRGASCHWHRYTTRTHPHLKPPGARHARAFSPCAPVSLFFFLPFIKTLRGLPFKALGSIVAGP